VTAGVCSQMQVKVGELFSRDLRLQCHQMVHCQATGVDTACNCGAGVQGHSIPLHPGVLALPHRTPSLWQPWRDGIAQDPAYGVHASRQVE
jgi:hypothetical protein